RHQCDYRQVSRKILFSFLTVILLFQFAGYLGKFLYFAKKTNEVPESKRGEILFGDAYVFTKESHKAFSGACRGQLITDIDIKTSGATEHRILAYLLYPINIRFDDKISRECLVYYKKSGAPALVPVDFKIVYQFDDQNLLAVKNE